MAATYSDKFSYAAKIVLDHEGGFVDDKNDRGGPTKGGISLKFLQAENIDINGDGKIDEQDILDLTEEKIIDLYYTCFWQRYGYEQIKSIILPTKILDLALPLGVEEAHKIVQRAANWLITRLYREDRTKGPIDFLEVDGVLGKKSFAAIDLILENYAGNEFIYSINEEATEVFYAITEAHPTDQKYLAGWLNRLKN